MSSAWEETHVSSLHDELLQQQSACFQTRLVMGLTLRSGRRGCLRLGQCWLASVGRGNRLSFHPLTLGHQVHGKQ